ncbi:MAG: hypothetical protein ACI86H_002132, partial [bacterium]
MDISSIEPNINLQSQNPPTLVGGVFQGSITLDMNITNQYVDLLDNEI